MSTGLRSSPREEFDGPPSDDGGTEREGVSGPSDPPGGQTLARRAVLASRVVFAGLAVAFVALAAADVTVPLRYRAFAYLGLMGTVSLYHGGFEHVANLRGRGERIRWLYVLAYLALIVVAYDLFVLSPILGVALAVTVTALKAGHGGIAVLDRLVGTDHLSARPQRALAVVVRGGAVLVPAYVVDPGLYGMYAGYMVNVFEPGALAPFAWAFESPTVTAVGGTYAAAVAIHLLWGGVRGSFGRTWRVDAAETLLLVGFFLAVPPAVAIGVYFPCWYAVRGIARLSTGDSGASTARGVFTRIARGGALPWVGALALFALAAVTVPRTPVSPAGWVGFYSVAVSVIAVPHVVVGSYLDRTRGIWST
ncbi:Brp/Blh family beta-carotene 15,15'-dioxygenase (plasmid) [Halobaculum sp. CBA1158]|uniref:Brp/Blh family beta-carotene 15,15'-dioxygenase n=1 Tax=Halobaculum sp. CBA1158 TaxID=2904243 RepID=UPI001F41E2BB|nr:Brp/Blh family beta-carotene 15,15'-dioxygenase [Halobaculum sp. CBA1158]UIP01413.1 Brp/Blh family beta-carotene 15,15'-dioxygenase [Halobaculum sp. CBA1158]